MKTTKPELEVPEAAVEMLKRIASFAPYECGEEFGPQPEIDARAIATPVVAAELRRLADEFAEHPQEQHKGTLLLVCRFLRDHAGRLEAGA